jgi:parallel beta-helix repeat protein
MTNFNAIDISANSVVTSSSVDFAGTTAGCGINVSGASNRIDSNHLTNNDAGVCVDTAGNATVVRNSFRGNSPNVSVTGGATIDLGPVGPASTATSPWANIAY